jgi:hypothetical protein
MVLVMRERMMLVRGRMESGAARGGDSTAGGRSVSAAGSIMLVAGRFSEEEMARREAGVLVEYVKTELVAETEAMVNAWPMRDTGRRRPRPAALSAIELFQLV